MDQVIHGVKVEDQQPIADTMLTAIASIETEEINSQITIVNFDKILTVEEYNISTQLQAPGSAFDIPDSAGHHVPGKQNGHAGGSGNVLAEAQAVQTQIKQRLDAHGCCGAHCL